MTALVQVNGQPIQLSALLAMAREPANLTLVGPDAYLEAVSSPGVAISPAGTMRLRYNDNTKALELSVDGGVYSALVTSAVGNGYTPGGNSFGQNTTVGLTDNFTLSVIANSLPFLTCVPATSEALVPATITLAVGAEGTEPRIRIASSATGLDWWAQTSHRTDNGVEDRVLQLGWNVGPLGTIRNPADIAWFDSWESGFSSPPGTVTAERHVEYRNGGTSRRPFSIGINTATHAAGVTTAGAFTALTSAGTEQVLHLPDGSGNAQFGSGSNGVSVYVGKNDISALLQDDSLGSPRSLAKLDGSNVWQLCAGKPANFGGAVSCTAGALTQSGGAFLVDANAASHITTTTGAAALTITAGDSSTWSTNAGVLTVNGAANLALQGWGSTVFTLDAAKVTLAASKGFLAAAGTADFNLSVMVGSFLFPQGDVTWTNPGGKFVRFNGPQIIDSVGTALQILSDNGIDKGIVFSRLGNNSWSLDSGQAAVHTAAFQFGGQNVFNCTFVGDILQTQASGGKVGLAAAGGFGVFAKAATPAAQQTGGAATAGGTYDATTQTMIQKAYDALRTFGFLS